MHQKIKELSFALVRAFNEKPKNAIKEIEKICKENGIINVNKQIAEFFLAEKGRLDLEAVGDYIGSEENADVLVHFIKDMDFKDKPFTEALRGFLKSFRLPGEAQKISRLLDAFASVYIQQNTNNQLADADAAFIMAFQIIMLNTDLHNSAIQKHMTIEQLKKM